MMGLLMTLAKDIFTAASTLSWPERFQHRYRILVARP